MEGESVGADIFDWCSGRSRSPLSSCHEAEKGDPTHVRGGRAGRGSDRRGLRDRYSVVRAPATVTVTRGAWRGHGRGGQEREVEAEQQGENVGVGPCRGGSTGGSG